MPLRVLKHVLVTCLCVLPSLNSIAKPLELSDIQVVPVQDSESSRRYDLYIKLPENYESDQETHYPVIYYTDALWHVELLSSTTAFLLENAILVGISWQTNIAPELLREEGQHVSRYRDYSFVPANNPDTQTKYKMGQADSHLRFIRNDVIRYIEKNYRTLPAQRTYFGYSLGGLFGLYTLISQPDTFNNYLLGSPSVWRPATLQDAINPELKSLNANVFISYGTEEDKLGPGIDTFLAYLQTRNDPTLKLTHKRIKGTHQTAFPLTGVTAITWLANLINKESDQ